MTTLAQPGVRLIHISRAVLQTRCDAVHGAVSPATLQTVRALWPRAVEALAVAFPAFVFAVALRNSLQVFPVRALWDARPNFGQNRAAVPAFNALLVRRSHASDALVVTALTRSRIINPRATLRYWSIAAGTHEGISA